jgi:hypothetical protein
MSSLQDILICHNILIISVSWSEWCNITPAYIVLFNLLDSELTSVDWWWFKIIVFMVMAWKTWCGDGDEWNREMFMWNITARWAMFWWEKISGCQRKPHENLSGAYSALLPEELWINPSWVYFFNSADSPPPGINKTSSGVKWVMSPKNSYTPQYTPVIRGCSKEILDFAYNQQLHHVCTCISIAYDKYCALSHTIHTAHIMCLNCTTPLKIC